MSGGSGVTPPTPPEPPACIAAALAECFNTHPGDYAYEQIMLAASAVWDALRNYPSNPFDDGVDLYEEAPGV